jgi:hypothetical protein
MNTMNNIISNNHYIMNTNGIFSGVIQYFNFNFTNVIQNSPSADWGIDEDIWAIQHDWDVELGPNVLSVIEPNARPTAEPNALSVTEPNDAVCEQVPEVPEHKVVICQPIFETDYRGECPICCDPMTMVDFCITRCGHAYHTSCLLESIMTSTESGCAMCRRQLIPDSALEYEDEEEEGEEGQEGQEGEEDDDETVWSDVSDDEDADEEPRHEDVRIVEITGDSLTGDMIMTFEPNR